MRKRNKDLHPTRRGKQTYSLSSPSHSASFSSSQIIQPSCFPQNHSIDIQSTAAPLFEPAVAQQQRVDTPIFATPNTCSTASAHHLMDHLLSPSHLQVSRLRLRLRPRAAEDTAAETAWWSCGGENCGDGHGDGARNNAARARRRAAVVPPRAPRDQSLRGLAKNSASTRAGPVASRPARGGTGSWLSAVRDMCASRHQYKLVFEPSLSQCLSVLLPLPFSLLPLHTYLSDISSHPHGTLTLLLESGGLSSTQGIRDL